jgi:hypothetical protein
MERFAPEPLCEICLDLRPRDPSQEEMQGGQHVYDPPPVTAYEASAEQGCWGCKIMVALFHDQGLDSETQYAILLVFRDTGQIGVYLVCWDIKVRPKLRYEYKHEIKILSFPSKSKFRNDILLL